jgi:hypothetical protein
MSKKIFPLLIAIILYSLSSVHIGYAASASTISAEQLTTLTKQINSLGTTMTKLLSNLDSDEDADLTSTLAEISELKTSLKSLNSNLKTCKNVETKLESLKTVISTSSSLSSVLKGDWGSLLTSLTALKTLTSLL